MKNPAAMTDHEWATAFVACQLPDMRWRAEDAVRVLEEKLAAVRAQPLFYCDPGIGQ